MARESNLSFPLVYPVLTLCSFFSGGMDYTKTVVEPIRQVVPRHTLRGFKEDYEDISADVLLIEGEIHLGRKPVSVDVLNKKRRPLLF